MAPQILDRLRKWLEGEGLGWSVLISLALVTSLGTVSFSPSAWAHSGPTGSPSRAHRHCCYSPHLSNSSGNDVRLQRTDTQSWEIITRGPNSHWMWVVYERLLRTKPRPRPGWKVCHLKRSSVGWRERGATWEPWGSLRGQSNPGQISGTRAVCGSPRDFS